MRRAPLTDRFQPRVSDAVRPGATDQATRPTGAPARPTGSALSPPPTAGAGRAGRERSASRARTRRAAIGDAFLLLVGAGLGVTLGLAIVAESRQALAAPGGVATAAARFSGLVAAYLLLVMVLVMARIPVIERSVGQIRLARWHRRIGGWPILLVAAHAILVTWAVAVTSRSGFGPTLVRFLRTYPDLLAATVGFALLVAIGVSSYRRCRRRLRYETWWALHLYVYLALALSFPHEMLGASFAQHPLTRVWWATMWGLTIGLVVLYRIVLPVRRTFTHRLRVAWVRQESPGVTSIICRGRHLERLQLEGGQFCQWRFLTRGMWWQAHPYSVSALPRPPFIRLTVKSLGDHSHGLSTIPLGTRVAIEGPYGSFTRHAVAGDAVALIGAGVGVTPLRALLEDLPPSVDASVVLRATTPEDLPLSDEFAGLIEQRDGQLHEVMGPGGSVRMDEPLLARLIPDLASRDVFVCGPARFTADVLAAVRALGTPAHRIHHEAFAF